MSDRRPGPSAITTFVASALSSATGLAFTTYGSPLSVGSIVTLIGGSLLMAGYTVLLAGLLATHRDEI